MVTEFASKLGDLSTVVSFSALVANGLIPELLLPKGLLLKHQAVRILTAFNYIKTGIASLGCISGFEFVANRNATFDCSVLFAQAMQTTAAHRDTTEQIADMVNTIRDISKSAALQGMCDKYRKQLAYAKQIPFERIIEVLRDICRQPF